MKRTLHRVVSKAFIIICLLTLKDFDRILKIQGELLQLTCFSPVVYLLA